MKKTKRYGKIFIGLIVSLCTATVGYFKNDLPKPLREYLGMADGARRHYLINRSENKSEIDSANPGELPLGLKVQDCQKLSSTGYEADIEDVMESFPENAELSFAVVNGNKPGFSEEELRLPEFESYGELDILGRCQTASAMLGKTMMPDEKRGSIGMIKPSGWQTKRYDDLIADRYLYNRCHLIGYQLSGQNANEKNLITGTRFFNVEGMLPFENMVAEYIKTTNNHVMYRVRPVFYERELVARGVQIEAESVENNSICFNVFIYNIQPDIEIDYLTGESRAK